jgi:hypothetical protein
MAGGELMVVHKLRVRYSNSGRDRAPGDWRGGLWSVIARVAKQSLLPDNGWTCDHTHPSVHRFRNSKAVRTCIPGSMESLAYQALMAQFLSYKRPKSVIARNEMTKQSPDLWRLPRFARNDRDCHGLTKSTPRVTEEFLNGPRNS